MRILFVLFVFVSSSVSGLEKTILTFRSGYFVFTNHNARTIYSGAPDMELEATFLIDRYLAPWVHANYLWTSGKTEALSSPTHLKMGMMSTGSKVFFSKLDASVLPYLGLGLCGIYAHIHDDSPYLAPHTIRWSGGLVGKMGTLLRKGSIILDLFVDYYYLPVKARPSSDSAFVNLGGVQLGGGFGTQF